MHAVAKALQALPRGRHLLAVSGGRDSMVMLDAFIENRRDALTAVATFDHGTGQAAMDAAALVERYCVERGVPVISGRPIDARRSTADAAPAGDGVRRTAHGFLSGRPTEAAWRTLRWSFLRGVAEEERADIVTAHTLDDQAETVAMRILRGASARGLASMAARAKGITRPLLSVRRSSIVAYAEARGVPFVDDPSNADIGYLRNRLRRDLLAAAELARPTFVAELYDLGERAASWRRTLASIVDDLGPELVGQSVVLSAAALDGIGVEGRSIIWPELAGRIGMTMDRRGVARASEWSMTASAGQRIPLSGGAVIERTARTFVLRAPAT